jgi:transcriptional regulator with XRE-family HTH domain
VELYRSIKKTVRASGKTQTQWAKASGVTPGNLSRYLNGHQDGNGKFIQRILYLMTPKQRILTINRVCWNGGAPPEDLELIQEFKDEIKEIERRMAAGEGME